MTRAIGPVWLLPLLAGALSCAPTTELGGQEEGARRRLVPQVWHEARAGALSPDGDYLLTGGFSKVVLWHVPTGAQILHLPTSGARPITFGPSGRTAMAGGTLWDLSDGSAIRSFEGGEAPVRSAVLSPDGRYVLTATLSRPEGPYDMSPPHGSIALRDPETGAEIRSYPGWAFAVFSPDGRRVLGAHPDGGAAVWNARTAAEVARLRPGSGAMDPDVGGLDGRLLTGGVFSPDGGLVVTISGGEATLWNLATESVLHRFGGSVTSAAFSPDGRRLLTGHADGMGARLWDVESGALVHHFLHPPEYDGPLAWFDEQNVGAVAFSPDGRSVVAVGGSHRLPDSDTSMLSARLWDVETGAKIRAFSGRTTPGGAVATSRDGRWAVAAGAVWDLEAGVQLERFSTVTGAAFSPAGELFLVADGRLHGWNLAAGGDVRRLGERFQDRIHSIAVSPDGDRIALGVGSDVRLLDTDDGSEVGRFSGHREDARPVAFSPDGRFLAGGDGSSVQVWNVETGEERRLRAEWMHQVTTVGFSPDNSYLLGAGVLDTGESPDRRSSVYLWNAETGELVERMRQDGRIHTALFSEGGHRVLTATTGSIRVWDPHWGAILREVPREGHDLGPIAAWGKGEIIVVGREGAANDGAAHLLDGESGARLLTLLSFTDGTWAVVAPDGRFDTDTREPAEGLRCVRPEDPFAPPLSILSCMRGSHEPRLLKRVLEDLPQLAR